MCAQISFGGALIKEYIKQKLVNEVTFLTPFSFRFFGHMKRLRELCHAKTLQKV